MSLPPGPRWTRARADAFLPSIDALLDSVHALIARRAGGGGAEGADPRLVLRGVLELLAEEGIVVRDLERGLIDFPATAPSGRDYWLCRLSGEERVDWWHWPEDGMAGRTRLDQTPPT
ncbi:MAG: hypothetical protein JWN46_3426 [Acidimicrobiales bacterium]|nr:hypothetical protein [Acidimicrobiales bacterium]